MPGLRISIKGDKLLHNLLNILVERVLKQLVNVNGCTQVTSVRLALEPELTISLTINNVDSLLTKYFWSELENLRMCVRPVLS